jgi:protein SCO1/2
MSNYKQLFKKNLLMMTILVFFILVVIFFINFLYDKKKPNISLGGSFILTDQHGKVFDSKKVTLKKLLYFGYTYCPDICPFDLMRNAQVVELLKNENIKIKPIFITLDPNRDTLETLKEYTDFHHNDMIGLTGSENDMQKIKDIFMVYSQMPNDLSGDYILNHSTFTYFVLPEIGLATYFTRKDKVKKISDTVKCILKNINS